MNHQLFENWLLSDESLDEEQQKALDAHLSECKTCNVLADALEQVEETLASHIAPAPASGFVQRWHNRLSIARQQRQQRRMWLTTLGLFFAAGLLMLTIFLLNINHVNWFYEISQVFANFTLIASRIKQVVRVTKTLLSELPILIPIIFVFGVGSISAIVTLIVTWISSMIKLYKAPNEGALVR